MHGIASPQKLLISYSKNKKVRNTGQNDEQRKEKKTRLFQFSLSNNKDNNSERKEHETPA